MIDFEAVALAWLAGEPDTQHAAGRLPASLDDAMIRMQLIAATPMPSSPAFDHGSGYLQIDCYAGAGGQAEAYDLAAAVARRLHSLPGQHDGGIVNAVTDLSIRRLPDTEMKPARERYIVECLVTGHHRRA